MAESGLHRGYRHALNCARSWANAARLGGAPIKGWELGGAPIKGWERGYIAGYLSGVESGARDHDRLERMGIENEVNFLFGDYQERRHA